MTSAVGIVGTVQGSAAFATSTPSTTPPSSSTSQASAFNISTQATPDTSSKDNSNVHSPRLVNDPSAGFITQYLSANGSEVVYQTPSAVTVAYLRLGLTADGSTKAEAAKAGTVTA